MNTLKVTFEEVSDRISKRLLSKNPTLTTREANVMGHDLARAMFRPFVNGGEVPTGFSLSDEALYGMLKICREGLLGA